MPSRNCETRPVTWRINYNESLATLSKDLGFEVWPFFIGCITSRDNLGRLEGNVFHLKGMFFPESRYPQVSIDQIKKIRDGLHDAGLIIVYMVKGIEYILIPKTSAFSEIVGNMTSKSDHPEPQADVIEHWEKAYNSVYTPCERRIKSVLPEDKDKGQDKGQNKDKGKGQDKGKCEKTLTALIKLKIKDQDKLACVKSMCKRMESRDWCQDPKICRDIVQGLVITMTPLVKAGRIPNPGGYLRTSLLKILNEAADMITDKVRVARKENGF